MAAGDWKDLLKGVQENDLALVSFHVEKGVDVNYQHPEFLTTPLIESVEVGNLAIAKFLLENGADPKIKAGFSNDTALSVAKAQKKKEFVQLIKQYL